MKDEERVPFGKDISYFKFHLNRIAKTLNELDKDTEYTDINDVIEMHNVKQYIDTFTCESWTEDETNIYNKKAAYIPRIVGKFFSTIEDSNLLMYCEKVDSHYHKAFWSIMCEYKRINNISSKAFEAYLKEFHNRAIYTILNYKSIVETFDKEIAEYLTEHNATAEIILYEYLAFKEKTHQKKYFPKSLTPKIMGNIIQKYIEAPEANLNYVRLLVKSSPKAEIGFTAKMKVLAKKIESERTSVMLEKGGVGFPVSVELAEDLEELQKIEQTDNSYKATYNPNLLLEPKTDKFSLLYNFIYPFGYFDSQMRSQIVSSPEDGSLLEFFCGIKAEKEYMVSFGKLVENNLHFMQMNMYDNLLKYNQIEIEQLIKWYFEEYLNEEFFVAGFVYSSSNEGATYLEKAKVLASEMDSILKQYRMYCEEGCIDREVFEISSEHTIFETLPSLQNKKYIYATETVFKASNFLMSSWLAFCYIPNQANYKYDSLVNILRNEQKVLVSDFDERAEEGIKLLQENGFISVNEGVISLTIRVKILENLKENGVICYSYYNDIGKKTIDEMLADGLLENHNTLFSNFESDYMNYMLNKATFENGFDLRNKYLHGSYPLDKKQNAIDYYQMLIIMILVLFKIHEEFLLNAEK